MSSSPSFQLDDLFGDYPLDSAFDEMREPGGELRAPYRALAETLARLPQEELQRRKQSADLSFLNQGITFTVYGHDEGTEKIFPYDLLPRLITASEWRHIERGLTQRVTALNHFLRDIYSGSAQLLHHRNRFRSAAPLEWRIRRSRRQPARAVGRKLHACQSPRNEAHVPAPLPQLWGAAH